MKKSTFFGRSSKSSNGKSPNGKSPTAATSKVAPANGSRTSSPKEVSLVRIYYNRFFMHCGMCIVCVQLI